MEITLFCPIDKFVVSGGCIFKFCDLVETLNRALCLAQCPLPLLITQQDILKYTLLVIRYFKSEKGIILLTSEDSYLY